MALYKTMIGQVQTPEGLSQPIFSTIGVREGYLVSRILFGLCMDGFSDYIARGGARGAQIVGTWILLLLYADDIVLIVDSQEGMRQYLDSLYTITQDIGLSINLRKVKAMVFNVMAQWVRTSSLALKYGQDTIEYVDFYIYLGIFFRGCVFSMRAAIEARLIGGYVALGVLEMTCS